MSHESFSRQDQTSGPSNKRLGLTFAAVFLLLALIPVLRGKAPLIWSVAASGAFALVAMVAPALLGPLNRAWMRFGLLLHRVVSPVVLGIMFFLVITPMGVIMNLVRKDPLKLRRDPTCDSYWVHRQPPGPRAADLPEQF